MKKLIIKLTVFASVFLIALTVAGRVMNEDHDNLTMEMAQPSLPIVQVVRNGVKYNELHGYKTAMNVAAFRDTVTVLSENRNFKIHIDTYGRNVTDVSIELRSVDGSRLIENTKIKELKYENAESASGSVEADIALKDLIEPDTEYSLRLGVVLDGEEEISYYTCVIWSEKLHPDEKLEFIRDFHRRLYDREQAKELTKYLETNGQLEDNTSFHNVNIHSSFKQITWGELNVREETEPVIKLTQIGEQTASFLMEYEVSTGSGKDKIFYRVVEHYRLRYTADRMYLLNFERTMTQIPNVDRMYANDKILLGITGTDIDMKESEDGSCVAFVLDGQLYSYNSDNNKLTVVFGFYDEDNMDRRAMYAEHSIKILDVSEGQNISFAVYGYMNRGRHEGEVGIQIYTYNSATNTIEENIYIPYTKSYAILKPQMERLLFLNRDQRLYLMLEDVVYAVDLEAKTYYPLASILQGDTVQVSDNNWILAWQEGDDAYHSRKLNIRNLNLETQQWVEVSEAEAIKPLGFIGEDIIYGVAREEEIIRGNSGRILFPMYKVCICDSNGTVLKEYAQEGTYVTDCVVESNQITLKRVQRTGSGGYTDAPDDQIMNSVESESGKYVIVAPAIEIYEKYVQIQTRRTIDSKTIQILTPKEVVFEGGRELVLESETKTQKYYVYGAYGVEEIYSTPAKAVILANQISGIVVDQDGNVIWSKGNRAIRNQIMAITETKVTEEKNSLALCLDTMLKYEGIIRNSEYLLAQGQTVIGILDENLGDARILDLAGCEMDAMLYFVNRDIPVLALLEDGNAVLLTGFNEYNVVVMDPKAGTLSKMGMNDATEWFKRNGNNFVTYVK